MLQKNIIPYFKKINYVCYKYLNISILEQIIKKNYKIYIIDYNFCYKTFPKFFNTLINFYLYSLTIIWVKLIFRGKGYRLRKFNKFNKLTLNFGRSHWTKYLYNRDLFFAKKLRRQKVLFFIKFYKYKYLFKKTLKFVKILNMYTKRGLRWKKQLIKRRFGKISQVVSSLH